MKVIYNDGTVAECPEEEELHVIRHSAAHIMAQAIKRLHPNADFAYGPATETGFYYDVDLGEEKLSDEDLAAIEAEMKKIVKENLPIRPFILPREEAIKLMEDLGEKYKVEHIGDLDPDAQISFYKQGEYTDMCVGPHLCYTKALKAFKITGQSGAYWKNDKNNKMLTRVKGIAFRNQTELDEHLKMLEEAEKRDHRRIGKEMGLFMLCDEAPGFPFFLPNGMKLKNALIDYWRELHTKAGYVEVSTPMIMNRKLWETSGHWDHYKDNMYSTVIDDDIYCVKPMNCPGGVMVYRSRPHSYRELPLRIGELGLVHRHELRGALHGLFRVRCFTQDDAHIFMRRDQITDEIAGVVHLINEVYGKFGFRYAVELSTRPENSMGSDEDWEAATAALQAALEEIDRLEQSYLELFLGKRIVSTETRRYVVCPQADKKQYIVCRFSPAAGLLPDTDLSGDIVLLQIEPSGAAKSDLEAGPKETQVVACRVADPSTCIVVSGGREYARAVLPVFEFGRTINVALPRRK